jgi:DNA-binding transcriptional LysR family regulator
MLMRQLHYFATLAEEKHFARAAAACNVTQPTLSSSIKQLEENLGVLLVERSHRFIGFTEEGERVLSWAQQVLADYEGLTQELGALRAGLTGRLAISAIPVALPAIHLLTEPFVEAHPRTTIRVLSQTTADIQRGLDSFNLDAGITYLDNEPLARVRTHPLYEECYWLVTPRTIGTERKTITWEEASALPLCLMTDDMQARRILDMHFREAGVVVRPSFETSSPLVLMSLLRTGRWSTILPTTFLHLVDTTRTLRAIALVEPDVRHVIGLVLAEREPLRPLAHALLQIAKRHDIGAAFQVLDKATL